MEKPANGTAGGQRKHRSAAFTPLQRARFSEAQDCSATPCNRTMKRRQRRASMRLAILSWPANPFRSRRARNAYTIIETAVYMSVLFVLLGAGYLAMDRCIDRSLALRRNADALTSALQAGEHWRTDVRAATGPIQNERGQSLVHIPSDRGEILYLFATNAVLRRSASNSWVRLLSNVKSSVMQRDAREQVTAWRWELELLTVKKDTSNTNRIQPLFTFIAVPNVTAVK
jgi:hypothetical protein